MDSIDIVDPTFALDVISDNIKEISDSLPSFPLPLPLDSAADSLTSSLDSSSSSYWFIGGLLLLLFIAMFVFRKAGNNRSLDCVGGFCSRVQREDGEREEDQE